MVQYSSKWLTTCLAVTWMYMSSVVMAGDERCDPRNAWIKPAGLCARCIDTP